MKRMLGPIVAVMMLVSGLFGSAGSVFAQEAAGNDPDDAYVNIVAYVCESASLAGTAEIFVSVVNEADEGTCRLGNADEFTFTLNSTTGGLLHTLSTTAYGLAGMPVTAPDSLVVTETNTNVSSVAFDVIAGDYASVTFVEYTASETEPFPSLGGSNFYIDYKVCVDAARAGTTVFFAGAAYAEASAEGSCVPGPDTGFTVTPVEFEGGSVGAAGFPSYIFEEFSVTTEGGSASGGVIAAGVWTVTRDSDNANSGDFSAVGDRTTSVTVIDFIAPEEPEPDGVASLTIHKAVCETGVGPDIFTECHDDALGNVTFWVNEAEWTTDDAGVVAGEVAAGDVEIVEDWDTFDDYLGGYVYCSEQGSGDVLIDTDTQDGAIEITVEDGDEVVCDWYNITAAAPVPDDDDDDKDDDKNDVNQLPSTGVGVAAMQPSGFALLTSLLGLGAVAGVYGLRTRRG